VRAVLALAVPLALAAGVAAAAEPAADDTDTLWTLLRGGGQVLMLRHAATDGTFGDPPGFRLDACATQRNLTPEGRAQARQIGEAYRARGIPVGRVLSSLWCRCLDTAELAFGRVEPLSALNGGPRRDAALVAARAREVRALLGTAPAGGNLVLVTHNINIRDATGESPEEGQLVIFTPLGGDRFTTVGRLTPGGLRCDPRSGRPC
jgi:broad specificity phosphatase PhoE